MLAAIKNTASYIRSKIDFEPEIGIILGTGLGHLADKIQNPQSLDYRDIPGFPVSTVEGHRGRLIFGELGGRRVVAMQGRFHYYEGYTPQQVTFPVRVMKMLGITTLIVSNAAGGVNPDFEQGDLMVIDNHINQIPNPLIGPNLNELGPRFPEMSQPYDAQLIELAHRTAATQALQLRQGCYVALTGPTLETPGEYNYVRLIGGDAVGMSTTPEVIVARHMNLRVFGLSVITNVSKSKDKASHAENERQGELAADRMSTLIIEMLKNS